VIKTRAKVVSHRRCLAFQLAEVAAPGQMYRDVPRLIAGTAGAAGTSI
jgi:hypothetical protein